MEKIIITITAEVTPHDKPVIKGLVKSAILDRFDGTALHVKSVEVAESETES